MICLCLKTIWFRFETQNCVCKENIQLGFGFLWVKISLSVSYQGSGWFRLQGAAR